MTNLWLRDSKTMVDLKSRDEIVARLADGPIEAVLVLDGTPCERFSFGDTITNGGGLSTLDFVLKSAKQLYNWRGVYGLVEIIDNALQVTAGGYQLSLSVELLEVHPFV